MGLRTVDIGEVVDSSDRFDAVIDVRSPAEFAEDHLPGAVNWPVLDDEQRRIVGTLYVQTSPLQARKVGAAMVARNIADHLERWVADWPRERQPLIYCWRGGQRSGALAWFLDQIGFRTAKLAGGYKAFRARVRDDLAALPAQFDYRVIVGRTGSGKTRLLHALARRGAQVLDLEALACHRGSVLGGVPGQAQPSQKRFDTLVWQTLRGFDRNRPVYVESESKKVGALQMPEALIERMHREGQCLRVEMPEPARVQLLLQDYGDFAAEPQRFCALLDGLVALRGRAQVKQWQDSACAGRWAQTFADLMLKHYDPMYLESMQRNYAGFDRARALVLADGEPATVDLLAREMLESVPKAA
jgi:tRNA 2-selenouridine synthase